MIWLNCLAHERTDDRSRCHGDSTPEYDPERRLEHASSARPRADGAECSATDKAGDRLDVDIKPSLAPKHRSPKPTDTLDQMSFFVERAHGKCSWFKNLHCDFSLSQREVERTSSEHSTPLMNAAREDCSRRAGTSLTSTQLFHRRLIGGIVVAFVGSDLPKQSGHLFVADGVGLIGEIHIHLRVFVVLAGHTVKEIGLV
jgi:hypothetical protein